MKSLLILPLLIVKSLSGPVDDHSSLPSMTDKSQIAIKECIVDTSQYKKLDPNLVGKKLYAKLKAGISSEKDLSNIDPSTLAIALKNAKYIHREYDTNKLCGLKVFKNATTGDFVVEYNSFLKSECATSSAQNIICNNSEKNKCDMVIRCCDPSNCELNAFLLKTLATINLRPVINNNGDLCAFNRNTKASCFTLASMVKEEKNSQARPGGQLNSLLYMLYITIAPYVLLN